MTLSEQVQKDMTDAMKAFKIVTAIAAGAVEAVYG